MAAAEEQHSSSPPPHIRSHPPVPPAHTPTPSPSALPHSTRTSKQCSTRPVPSPRDLFPIVSKKFDVIGAEMLTVFLSHVTAVNHLQNPSTSSQSRQTGPSNAPPVTGAVAGIGAPCNAVVVLADDHAGTAVCHEA